MNPSTNIVSLVNIFAKALNVSEDLIQGIIADSKESPEELISRAQEGFANTCEQMGQSQDTVIQYAKLMGLGPSGWGLIAGPSYLKNIYEDSALNNHFGWTVLRSDGDASSVQSFATAAFIQDGHLIYMCDRENLNGFWKKFD